VGARKRYIPYLFIQLYPLHDYPTNLRGGNKKLSFAPYVVLLYHDIMVIIICVIVSLLPLLSKN
jgi:hypothetical protein